jgi:hypothetical protein
MSLRLPFIQEMAYKCGCIVFMLSYRGYGSSMGSPSQVIHGVPLSWMKTLVAPADAVRGGGGLIVER